MASKGRAAPVSLLGPYFDMAIKALQKAGKSDDTGVPPEAISAA